MQDALDWIHRTDRGRREFIQRFFRQDINDPHLYDLVINVERFGPAGAAEQIVHAVRHGQSRSLEPGMDDCAVPATGNRSELPLASSTLAGFRQE